MQKFKLKLPPFWVLTFVMQAVLLTEFYFTGRHHKLLSSIAIFALLDVFLIGGTYALIARRKKHSSRS